MALLDFMLLNAWKMWNMSVDRIEGRECLQRFEFLQIVARELLTYKTPSLVLPQKLPGRQQVQRNEQVEAHDKHEFVEPTGKSKRCVVCALETTHYQKQLKKYRASASQLFCQKVRDSYHGTRTNVLHCR